MYCNKRRTKLKLSLFSPSLVPSPAAGRENCVLWKGDMQTQTKCLTPRKEIRTTGNTLSPIVVCVCHVCMERERYFPFICTIPDVNVKKLRTCLQGDAETIQGIRPFIVCVLYHSNMKYIFQRVKKLCMMTILFRYSLYIYS